jgi:hypothetical protein
MWKTTRQAVRDGERAITAARRTAVAALHQARSSRKHADIAERTLLGLERPYIFLGTIQGKLHGINDPATLETRPTEFRVDFNLDNKGRTPAIIRAINRKILFKPSIAFDEPPYDYSYTLHGGESVIGVSDPPAPFHNVSFEGFDQLGITTTDDQEFKDRAFFFFGFVIYSDSLQNLFKKGFGFIYSPARKTFLPFGGSAYNYDRKYDGADDEKFPEMIA